MPVVCRRPCWCSGFESADHPVEAWMSRALELCRDFGGVVPEGARFTDALGDVGGAGGGEAAGDTWRSSFLRMPYQRDALAARSMIVETFETACTWSGFEALRSGVVAAAEDALRQLGLVGVVSCRFSHVYPDGPAPYFGVYAAGHMGQDRRAVGRDQGCRIGRVDLERRHDHSPPRGRTRPPTLVRPAATRVVRSDPARIKASPGPRRNPQPRSPHD